MRRSLLAMAVLLGTSSAAASEPLVVDPWLEQALSEIIDPWAGSTTTGLYESDEIVDPWAGLGSRIVPTAAFPLLD